jgi:hypothetical protein
MEIAKLVVLADYFVQSAEDDRWLRSRFMKSS